MCWVRDNKYIIAFVFVTTGMLLPNFLQHFYQQIPQKLQMLSLKKNAANAEICSYRERVVSNSAEVFNFGAIKKVLCAINFFSWDKIAARSCECCIFTCSR